jgi:hypothetical protein
MSESNKWKSKLLSSSVPMEYEVAQILVEKDFSTDVDFSYTRMDSGLEKDFSVDLRATSYINDIQAVIELLVECKYRHPSNKWLFFEDPNDGDFSRFTLGYTLRAVDGFSWRFFPANATVAFDKNNCFCIKGVEVDTFNGGVHDSEIRHGLLQLQYALPRLLTDRISFEIYHPEDENSPFFFCPILLTTSPIFVARPGVKIGTVEQADRMEDFSTAAPWVVVHSDLTPEFERHRATQCAELLKIAGEPWVKELSMLREAKGEYKHRLPSEQLRMLSGQERGRPYEYFSQTIVCSLEHFPRLLQEIKRTTQSAANKLKEHAPKRQSK